MAGTTAAPTGLRDFALARYELDGTLDATFGTGGTVTTAVTPLDAAARAVAVQADGKIVAAGFAQGTRGWAVVRFETDVGLALDQRLALAMDQAGDLVVAGTATVDGTTEIGVARYLAANAVRAICGNGIEEPSEECDDGGRNGTDECCTIGCHLVDSDADGICDNDDPCTAPSFVATPRLSLSKTGPPWGDDGLVFKGTVVLTPPEYDPLAYGIRFRIQDRYTTVLDATLPGGARDGSPSQGWKVKGRTVVWVDRSASPIGGIVKIVLRRRPRSNRVQVVVRGRYGSYPIVSLPITAMILLDTRAAQDSQCGEIDFGTTCTRGTRTDAGAVRCR